MAKHLFAGLCFFAVLSAYYPAPALASKDSDLPLSGFTFTEPHMGTRFKIIVYARDEPSAKAAVKAAFQRIADLDDIMN
jgi:hypothetical protein